MKKDEIRKLQNHFNNGIKDGFQAKVYYFVNDRVHLKGTKINGTVLGVIFKDDRNYPYLKIKWDEKPETEKKFYDPFDVVKERRKEEKKEKKTYVNFYLEEKKNVNGITEKDC